jgi:hypothetical protein
MSAELMVGAKGLFIVVNGIDSGFWLVAVVSCYCPDSGFLDSSLLLAAQVFHSIQEGH